MARNTFAIIGILAVLLMGIGMVSAGSENGFELVVVGAGSSSSDAISGNPGDIVNFTAQFNNSNSTYQSINLSLSGIDITAQEIPVSGNNTFNVSFKIPSTQATQSRTLNGMVNASGVTIGTISDMIYYNVTPAISVPGCMDSSATNYDPTATVSDDSCTYADSWCSEFSGEKGNDLEITTVDVINLGQGDDDKWEFLDKIEIEITVENTNDDDSIDDVIIEIEIRDNKNNTYSKKTFDLDDISEDVGRIKSDGDEETVTFTINEVPIDLEDKEYRLYVRAYEDGNEDNQCVSESEDLENDDDDDRYFQFEVEASTDSAIIVKNDLDNIQASCGDDNVEVKFRVYNTGDDKEDKILVNLYNSRLEIDEYVVIDNLREERNKEVSFFVSIPEKQQKNSAELDILIHYDYEEDEDELSEFSYDKNSEDEGSDFGIILEILSCSAPEPTVNAKLESAAEVGADLVVKALITNNGEDNDFDFSISNFESWADIVSVTPQTDSIDEGAFTEVTITLTPKVAGAQSFKINTVIDGDSSSQTVSVNIAEEPGLFGGLSDAVTYSIIGIIALIVLILLVLISRVSRRPAKPQF